MWSTLFTAGESEGRIPGGYARLVITHLTLLPFPRPTNGAIPVRNLMPAISVTRDSLNAAMSGPIKSRMSKQSLLPVVWTTVGNNSPSLATSRSGFDHSPVNNKDFFYLTIAQSHQNKFHAMTLRSLTVKFSAMREGEPMTPQDRDLWEYFATLYKNSNKGIKGRGKDRRISCTAKSNTHGDGGTSAQTSGSDDDVKKRCSSFEESSYNDGSSSDEEVRGHFLSNRRD